MYDKIGKIAEFFYGKSPKFYGSKDSKQMKVFFYHFRIWLGVILNTWFFFYVITGQAQGLANESFVFKLVSGFGIWLGIWFIVKMASFASS